MRCSISLSDYQRSSYLWLKLPTKEALDHKNHLNFVFDSRYCNINSVSANWRETHLTTSMKPFLFSVSLSQISWIFWLWLCDQTLFFSVFLSFPQSRNRCLFISLHLFYVLFSNVWMSVDSGQWCTVVTVKPTLFFILSWNVRILTIILMFYKHWLVQNENLSCLKYFV